MVPLVQFGLFSSTYLSENTCVTGPGGCSAYWNVNGSSLEKPLPQRNSSDVDNDGTPPHFGINSALSGTYDPVLDGMGRCFTSKGAPTFCQEYDSALQLFNFGPASKMMWRTRRKLGIDIAAENQSDVEVTREIPNNIPFINPVISGHNGLDVPSLP